MWYFATEWLAGCCILYVNHAVYFLCLPLLCHTITYHAENVKLYFHCALLSRDFFITVAWFCQFPQKIRWFLLKNPPDWHNWRIFLTLIWLMVFFIHISLTHFTTWHLPVINVLCPCLDEGCRCHVSLATVWVGCKGSLQHRKSGGMMTSSNGSIFRVTGPLCGEFTGHRWIPLTKVSNAELWYFHWSAPWINGWVNNHEAADLRRQRPHYDVIVMGMQLQYRHRKPHLSISTLSLLQ